MSAPTENLVRSAFVDRGTTVKHDGDRPKLHGYFSTFNDWYEVNSTREGRFMERLAPGAFTRTLTENRDRIKVLYDHGMDPQLANKPLGHWTAGEDSRGAWYDVELIDTDYNRNFVIPAGDAGLLGSSFRFSVADKGESWSTPTRSANHNPHRLRERTITDVDVYEFGPVTFPANGAVGAVGIRSTTDEWTDRILHDPFFIARFTERAGLAVVERILATMPDDVRTAIQPHPEGSQPPAATSVPTKEQREAQAARLRQRKDNL
jgi:HK97 family phage prohead protease